MSKGFYAGSFDPFTIGHLHVVKSAALLFDHVYIGMGINPDKTPRFDKEQMRNAIEKVLKREKLTNVSVLVYSELTAPKAKELGCDFLIKGIRNGMDYGKEENEASTNQEFFDMDTIYIRAGKFGNISSSLVMLLLKYKEDVSGLLPKEIYELIT